MRGEQVSEGGPLLGSGAARLLRGFPAAAAGRAGPGAGTPRRVGRAGPGGRPTPPCRGAAAARTWPGRGLDVDWNSRLRSPGRSLSGPASRPARPEEGRWRGPRGGSAGGGRARGEGAREAGAGGRPLVARAGPSLQAAGGGGVGAARAGLGSGPQARRDPVGPSRPGERAPSACAAATPGPGARRPCETRAERTPRADSMTHFNKGPSYGLSAEVKNKVRGLGWGWGWGGRRKRRGREWPRVPAAAGRPPAFVPRNPAAPAWGPGAGRPAGRAPPGRGLPRGAAPLGGAGLRGRRPGSSPRRAPPPRPLPALGPRAPASTVRRVRGQPGPPLFRGREAAERPSPDLRQPRRDGTPGTLPFLRISVPRGELRPLLRGTETKPSARFGVLSAETGAF